MANEYQKQAQEWLDQFGISLTITLIGFEKHFPDDKQARNVYRFTMRNKKTRKSYTGNFGASLADGRCTPYDVLACLTKGDVGSFEDFCADYGYDEDSRTAERTYEAVCKEWAGVERVVDTGAARIALQEIA